MELLERRLFNTTVSAKSDDPIQIQRNQLFNIIGTTSAGFDFDGMVEVSCIENLES